MESRYFLIFAVFSAAAIAEFLSGVIAVKAALSDGNNALTLVIPMTADTECAELILRQTLDIMNCSEMELSAIIIDLGADEETLEICRRFSESYGVFELCG